MVNKGNDLPPPYNMLNCVQSGKIIGRIMGPNNSTHYAINGNTCTRGRGGVPVNTSEFFLQGPWDWFRHGLCMSRLWLSRVRGGFVCPCRWVAFGFGFGRPAWRWFRLAYVGSRLALVLVMRGGFVLFSFVRRLVLVDTGKKLKKCVVN